MLFQLAYIDFFTDRLPNVNRAANVGGTYSCYTQGKLQASDIFYTIQARF